MHSFSICPLLMKCLIGMVLLCQLWSNVGSHTFQLTTDLWELTEPGSLETSGSEEEDHKKEKEDKIGMEIYALRTFDPYLGEMTLDALLPPTKRRCEVISPPPEQFPSIA